MDPILTTCAVFVVACVGVAIRDARRYRRQVTVEHQEFVAEVHEAAAPGCWAWDEPAIDVSWPEERAA